MALVGNLSGSSLQNSVIGVTGSLVIANTTANFPSLASDTTFFVSGSRNGNDRSVFGGTVVISGSANIGDNLTAASGTFTGDVSVAGNLSVNGTTTYINTQNLLVKDPFVLLNSGSTGSDMGIVFGGGNTTNDVVLGVNNKDGTLAAVTMDSTSGSLTAIDAGILTKVYASNFMVGAGGSAVTTTPVGQLSGSGADVYLKSTNLMYLSGGNGQVSLAANGTEWSTFSTNFPNSSLINSINLVSASANSAANTPQYFASPSAGNLYTTGSTAFGITAAPSSIGSDVFFFVSGSVGNNKKAVFGGDEVVSGSLNVKSGVTVAGGNLTVSAGTMNMTGSIIPGADVTYNLGTANQRWANIYTGDLHLRNERGDWTVIEEEDYLSIRNNKTGKMYKFVLEAVN